MAKIPIATKKKIVLKDDNKEFETTQKMIDEEKLWKEAQRKEEVIQKNIEMDEDEYEEELGYELHGMGENDGDL